MNEYFRLQLSYTRSTRGLRLWKVLVIEGLGYEYVYFI